MGLLSWASDKAYIQRAINQLRAEHDQFVRTAAKQLGTTYWTLAPEIAAANNPHVNYDIHGQYVFTGYSRTFPSQLVSTGGTCTWTIWYRYGPLTTIPQQTAATWEAAHAKGHAAELARMQQAVNDQAIAELRRLYPHSVKALVNA